MTEKERKAEYYKTHRAKILKRSSDRYYREIEAIKRYRRKHKKRIREANCDWRRKNRKRCRLASRRWAERNPEKVKRIRLRQYGISLEDFFSLQKRQKNRCGICKKQFDKTPMVDHCHKTKKVRGLLCGTCNSGLGMFKDSLTGLKSAVDYLECSIKNGTKKC